MHLYRVASRVEFSRSIQIQFPLSGHAVDAADAQDRSRGPAAGAGGLKAGHCAIATTFPNDFDKGEKDHEASRVRIEIPYASNGVCSFPELFRGAFPFTRDN